ncbi:uncharacterized protein LOC116977772 [Amblyraja radiata]|uniref:uncharacterized protein LOC116977772 n=1 Tax=Amblyraja radiata TaxID=386614 RepID=UPI001402F100|nr:uncharacterized protein LOC116977772 [Amblyraja radiata]
MARNEEKQLGKLNRLWLQKEKDEGRIREIHQNRPKLSSLNSAIDVKKWIPSIKSEIEYYLQQSQLSHYSERKIQEFDNHIGELQKEYRCYLWKLRHLDPSHKEHPWKPRAYTRKRPATINQQDAPLCLWFKSQGSECGKLSPSGNKSGSGGKNFTPTQQWIIDKWGFINSHIILEERRQSTKKFDKKKPLPCLSSEEEFDPLEGTSGSTPSTSQQHSKRSKTTASSTAGSTPTATEVEEEEGSQQELIKTLMQQATEAREARQAMTQPQTPHEKAVDTFLGFLKTELLKIPENLWFNYSVSAMTMAHKFSQSTQQQMGRPQMGPPQQMPLMGPPHQQAHQPPSLMAPSQMPPPVMPCSPMATSPMGRSPSSTGQQQQYSQKQQQQPTSTPSPQPSSTPSQQPHTLPCSLQDLVASLHSQLHSLTTPALTHPDLHQ